MLKGKLSHSLIRTTLNVNSLLCLVSVRRENGYFLPESASESKASKELRSLSSLPQDPASFSYFVFKDIISV